MAHARPPGVLIPAYQTVDSLGAVLAGVRAAEPRALVLVVDDGSTDGTGEVAREAGVEVITHPVNRGKGAALQDGFRTLMERTWAVVTVDADGQHEPAEIPRLLRRLGETGAAICVGTRMRDVRTMPWLRRLANRGSSRLLSFLAGARLEDTQSGYRAYRGEALPLLLGCGTGYDYESEVLIRACRLGMLVVFESVTTRYGDERSHFRIVRDGLRFVRLVARNLPAVRGGVGARARIRYPRPEA